MRAKEKPLGLLAAWSMAVGGMIGGGMFATLGLMLQIAGPSAWFSFILAGVVAFATARSYAALTIRSGQGGGLYRFLIDAGRKRQAGAVALLLTAAYVLSMAVYAYTFGAYVGKVVPGLEWLPGALAAGSIIVVLALNLAGAAQASLAEILAVAIKLAGLAALVAFGLARFEMEPFLPRGGIGPEGQAILLGSATVFMAFQGFQLLAYDYHELKNPKRNLFRAFDWAILTTTIVYILVAIASVLLVGVDTIVENRETALSEMGRAALGSTGFAIMVGIAGLATITAINATLFANARLARMVAREGNVALLGADRAPAGLSTYLIVLSVPALVLAMFGGLEQLIRWASFLFLVVFAGVNWIAIRQGVGSRLLAIMGMVGTIGFALALLAARLT